MTTGMIGIGIICLLYYIFTLMVGMDFAIIWAIGAVVCIGGGIGGKYIHHHAISVPFPVKAIGGIVIGAALLLFILIEGLIISGMGSKGKVGLDYVIVLGAQVRGSVPSKALYSRIKTAGEYLKENPSTKAVLSGGPGPGESVSEAQVMYDYLTEMGIEAERLILEDKSTSTMENLEFSAALLEKDDRIGIVSQNFHIYRSLRLAKAQDYTQVCGIAAKAEFKYLPHYMVRECFAVIKEKLIGNI